MKDIITENNSGQTTEHRESSRQVPEHSVLENESAKSAEPIKAKYGTVIKDTFLVAVQVCILVMIIMNFIGRISIVQGSSMFPSLENDNRVLINLITYHFRKPERGDIIVFRCPVNQKRDYIKRVIALPGEEIEIRKGKVYINGSLLKEDYLRNISSKESYRKITVPPQCFYVMGDNRINSEDSRYWGPVDYKLIKGKANLVFWPPGSFHVLK
jgi:signal peptidase I